jgi:hypothetical protein
MSSIAMLSKALGSPLLILIVCLAFTANSAEKTYSTKNLDEVEVISLLLASEAKANNWTKDDLICVSIENKDPDKKLVKTLRHLGLNICPLSEWRRHFVCGFHIYLRFVSFDPSKMARLHSDVADVREINSGDAHIAVRLREGEYSVRKTEGKWSISDYVPSN